MTYLEYLSAKIQTETDAKHDFEKILSDFLEQGYSYRDLAEFFLRLPETGIKPKTV